MKPTTAYLERMNKHNFWKKAGRASRAGAEGPRIGYDLDGVLASESGLLFRLARRIQLPVLTRHCQRSARFLLHPFRLERGVIISCRNETERPGTERWLREHGIKLPLILCADTGEKAIRINALKLTTFYENQRNVAYRLALLCPGTSIRLTGEVRD